MSFLEKLGPKIITADKKLTSTLTLQEQKYLAIYMGAKWSPASQAFKEKLIEFYKEINEGDSLMEIIYLSWDNCEKDFVEELEQMPWLAIPFKTKFRYSFYNDFKKHFPGLPSLVIFSPSNGEIVEAGGRKEIELNKEEFSERLKNGI